MADEDSPNNVLGKLPPVAKPESGYKKMNIESEQKAEKPPPSIPPKSEGISPQFKSGYEEGYKDCTEPPEGASAEFKIGYEQGCKDAKGGKAKKKFL